MMINIDDNHQMKCKSCLKNTVGVLKEKQLIKMVSYMIMRSLCRTQVGTKSILYDNRIQKKDIRVNRKQHKKTTKQLHKYPGSKP